MEDIEPPTTQGLPITLPSLTRLRPLRSVKDLDRGEFCDPHDPCCVNRDPEVFLHQDVLRGQHRKECVPRNPLHFEYTILHRMKMRSRLKMAAELQQNPELTEAEKQLLLEEEAAATSMETLARQNKPAVTSSLEYFSEHPEIAPPSPSLINGEELKRTLEGLKSVALAHEIALNKDFKLVKPEKESELVVKCTDSEEKSQLAVDATGVTKEAQMTVDAKGRYWKMVDHILLTKTFKDAKNTMLDLMNTLKTTLTATILPHNLRLRMKIDHELDLRRISKEIDREQFDINHYMDFILDTLSALCCPIHDQEILEIRNIEVPSRQIRECIDLMESMNLDMANFIIKQSRTQVLQNCVLYERNNFANFIESLYKNGKDPLRITRHWIRRHTIPDRTLNETMTLCFSELLESSDKTEIPETLTLDLHRFPRIRNEINRVTLIGGILYTLHDHSHNLLPEVDPNEFEKFQISCLKNVQLLNDMRGELESILSKEEKLPNEQKMEKCVELCAEMMDQFMVAEICTGMDPQQREELIGVIRPLENDSHPVRVDLRNRITRWFADVAREEGRGKIEAPSTLPLIEPLIIKPITEMVRVCMYNRAVFDTLYREIHEGRCGPPTVYPPEELKEELGEATVVLDANKLLGDSRSKEDEEPPFPVDEGIKNVVKKLRDFSGRTVVYRRSHIDPRIKPMYDSEGNYIVPPEQQPDYKAKEMTPIEQKHFDEYLLAHEPTLEEDYEGIYVFNVGDPDWMFGYTTEQLLKMMERENLINANKLRRIKERLYHEVLEQRVTANLPIFQKIWRDEVGNLQKEFCRLERIVNKGPTPVPEGSSDEPSGKRVFPGACEIKPQTVEEKPMFTKKGERILYSRGLGSQFANTTYGGEEHEDPDGMDLSRFERYEAEGNEEEVNNGTRKGFADGRRLYENTSKSYYAPRQRPETPMQLLSRNISMNIEREKTTKLKVGGITIHIQKWFEKSLIPPPKDFRKPQPNPFLKKRRSQARLNFYPGSIDEDSMFEMPQRLSRPGTQPTVVPLLSLPLFQERKATQIKRRPSRQRSPYPGPPMTKAAFMAKRRSYQFQIRDPNTPRKSAPVGPHYSRNSLDSLQTVLGSLQDMHMRSASIKKSKGKSLIAEVAPPPPEEEDDEDQEMEEEDDGGAQKSGKIRFEIPEGDEAKVKDPTLKLKIRERRPTSLRTTRFTVPEGLAPDPDRAGKIQSRRHTSGVSLKKTPRFNAPPEKPQKMDRRASLKIRERRPTPLLSNPMFAFLPQSIEANNRMESRPVHSHFHGPQNDPLQKGGIAPQVGLFPHFPPNRNRSQKIQQRSKTPEPNEIAQELKKSTIPSKKVRRLTGEIAPTAGDLIGSSRADLDALNILKDEEEDVGTGLMRIKKRRNIGRVLTPPYSRNERSSSLTVLDFRSSVFYKRSKSAVPQNKAEMEGRKQLTMKRGGSRITLTGGDWKSTEKMK